ncbi:helix-turn-helix protein [Murinocardiopsis flavida]|uniref:Helix-turn-helix protein n=1 Tax=Murinocardiopsis flavida TaxID=645275 RepID=A0A2P8DSG3_9ACTN|nr:helix-turn-helix transcriptional regulator [Murinocardiopsis flavida]PSL00150.1 helix-turn-helix protein [Murinocardiopsis flavida]
MTDYQTARVSLGARLREVRVEAGLSGRALAQELGWHPSKVSKLELGRQSSTVADLTSWARACGSPQLTAELIAQRRAMETHYASWRRRLAAGTRARQTASAALEGRTRSLRVFESMCVPGLLQTAEYAWHVMRPGSVLHSAPDDLGSGVRARMERQRILDEPGRSFDLVLWEPALWMRPCPSAVMAGQLDHLAVLIRRGRGNIGVVPRGTRLAALPVHGFWIFDDDRVHVETIGAELRLTDSDAIAPYRTVFTDLSKAAVRGPEALRIVARVRHELFGEPST